MSDKIREAIEALDEVASDQSYAYQGPISVLVDTAKKLLDTKERLFKAASYFQDKSKLLDEHDILEDLKSILDLKQEIGNPHLWIVNSGTSFQLNESNEDNAEIEIFDDSFSGVYYAFMIGYMNNNLQQILHLVEKGLKNGD